ncbi:MAG: hypothetical protein WB052_10710, partial [Pseudolabrys sp.]
APTFRDLVARLMTPAQIAEAQKLAREWKPNIALSLETPLRGLRSRQPALTGNGENGSPWSVAGNSG